MSIKHYTPNEHLRDDDLTLLIGTMFRRIIRQSNVSIGTSAAKIPTTPLSMRLSIIIFNNSANILYIGDSTVTTTNGYPIYPHGGIQLYLEDGIDIYGVASGSGSDIRILEGG